MTAPRTRFTEANNDFERDLLRSWESERPSDGARRAALGILGAGVTLGATTAASAASGATVAGSVGGSLAPKASSLIVVAVGKWLAAGAVVAAGLSQVHCGNREVRSDEDLSALARAASHTVYHVSCTARMGAPAFPSLTTVNPVIAVLMLAERGAEIVARAARAA